MKVCKQCGYQIVYEVKFCPNCGSPLPEDASAAGRASPPNGQQPMQQQASPQQPAGYPPPNPQQRAAYQQPMNQQQPVAYQQGAGQQPPSYQQPAGYQQGAVPPQTQVAYAQGAKPAKKNPALLIGAIVGAGVLVVATVLIVVMVALNSGKDAKITFSYLSEPLSPEISYVVTDTVFPSLYRSLDSLVTFHATCEGGEMDVLIEAEVPGFTQKYQQKFTLGEQITKLDIRPPLLTSDMNLTSEKDAQLVFSVTEASTGKVIIQDSKSITIKSKYDMIWWTEEFGDMNTDNILAWMTPEASGVLELKRGAVDYLDYISDGAINSIVGYQNYGFDDVSLNTWYQAVAIQGAMSDVMMIRYNNAAFSISSGVQQRVMLPEDVVASRSGICIETALLMASALQSADMHVMLIFPPGHAQVAVECWPNTGEYFLIETTVLPLPMDIQSFQNVVCYLNKDQWLGYIDGTGDYTLGECYVLDCDLGKKLGIIPMSN